MLPDPHRARQREGVAGPRLFLGRSDDPDVFGERGRQLLQHDQTRRVNAVIVGDKDSHSGTIRPSQSCGR